MRLTTALQGMVPLQILGEWRDWLGAQEWLCARLSVCGHSMSLANVMTSMTQPRGCHPPLVLRACLLGHHPRAQEERPMSSEVSTHCILGLCRFCLSCPLPPPPPPSLSLNHKQLGETMK